MKTKLELFELDYEHSLEKEMLFKRLDVLSHDSEKNQEEIDKILDRVNEIKDRLKRFYKIYE